MNKKLGVGIIGLGVGEQLAIAFHTNPDCEIKVLCDHNIEKAKEVSHMLGSGEIVTDYMDLIKRDDIDIVTVASYDDDHHKQLVAALKAGKHIFSEKPLVQTIEQLREVKNLWYSSEGKQKFYCNLVLRGAPIYKWLKEKVESGEFGEIYAYEGDYLYGRIHKLISGWRGHRAEYAAILGGGIHLIDLMTWIVKDKPESVLMVSNKICTRDTNVKHPDFEQALLFSKDGIVSKVTSNLGCVHRHHHILRIYGTEATFINDDRGPRIHYTRDPAVRASDVDLPTLPESKGILVAEFVDAILNDKDISAETQSMFDSASIGIGCVQSGVVNKVLKIEYV